MGAKASRMVAEFGSDQKYEYASINRRAPRVGWVGYRFRRWGRIMIGTLATCRVLVRDVTPGNKG
jgi:hypothetical protein